MAQRYQCPILYNFFPCTDEEGSDTDPKRAFRGSPWANGTFSPKEPWDHGINMHLPRTACICSCLVDGGWTGSGPRSLEVKGQSSKSPNRTHIIGSLTSLTWPSMDPEMWNLFTLTLMIPLYKLKISIVLINSFFPWFSFLPGPSEYDPFSFTWSISALCHVLF